MTRRGQVWWVRYYRGGLEHRESARTEDREVAIRLLHSRLAELPVNGLPKPETVTFEDLAQGYIQARIVNGVKGGHLLLHNNHHAYPSSPKFSMGRFEFDPSWVVIRVLMLLRLARPVGEKVKLAA